MLLWSEIFNPIWATHFNNDTCKISLQRDIEGYMETLLLRLFKSFSLRQQIKVKEVTVCSSSATYRVKHVPKKYRKKIIENTCIKFWKLLFPGEHSDISPRKLVTLQNIAHVIQCQKTTWPRNRKSDFKLFSKCYTGDGIIVCKNEPGGVTICASSPAKGLRLLYHTERADLIHFSSKIKLHFLSSPFWISRRYISTTKRDELPQSHFSFLAPPPHWDLCYYLATVGRLP